MPAAVKKILLFVLTAMFGVSCSDFWVEPQMAQITVTPATPSMVVGTKQQFTAVATYEDGSRKVLSLPTWATSSASVLMVDEKGMGTAIAAGSATLSATSGVASGSTTVTVVTSPMTSIQVSPSNPSISLANQKTQQFTATATYADGTVQDITNTVTWTSSNTAVATVSTAGLATANVVGSAQIKATSGSTSNYTTLTVVP